MALSGAARSFEHALANESPDIERLAAQVQIETHAAIEILDVLMGESRMHPA